MRSSYRRGTFVVPFSPLSISATALWWTEGTELAALGLADGAAVSTFPDEIGTADFTQATASAKPAYQASVAQLGNRPTLRFDGTTDFMAATIALTQPTEYLVIARYTTAPIA